MEGKFAKKNLPRVNSPLVVCPPSEVPLSSSASAAAYTTAAQTRNNPMQFSTRCKAKLQPLHFSTLCEDKLQACSQAASRQHYDMHPAGCSRAFLHPACRALPSAGHQQPQNHPALPSCPLHRTPDLIHLLPVPILISSLCPVPAPAAATHSFTPLVLTPSALPVPLPLHFPLPLPLPLTHPFRLCLSLSLLLPLLPRHNFSFALMAQTRIPDPPWSAPETDPPWRARGSLRSLRSVFSTGTGSSPQYDIINWHGSMVQRV